MVCTLTDAARVEAARALAEDGVAFLPKALDAGDMALVEAAIEDALARPSPLARRFYPKSGATFFEDRGDASTAPRYLELVRRTGISRMVAGIWGTDELWYLGEQLFLKEGGHSRRTPWHQDTSYLRMGGDHLVAVWLSLDPLPRRHSLESVRGSHRGKLYNGSAFDTRDDTAPLYAKGDLPRLPDIEADRDKWDIVSWDTEPGDLIVFHLGVLHGGAGTEPGMRRRTVSLRFMGPRCVYEDRPTDDEDTAAGNDKVLGGLYAGLKTGDPFRSPLLPRVTL
jgi:hypothetical protein